MVVTLPVMLYMHRNKIDYPFESLSLDIFHRLRIDNLRVGEDTFKKLSI